MKWFWLCIWALTGTLVAKPQTSNYIPQALEPWVDWVRAVDRDCNWLQGNRYCSWPGPLSLRLSAQSGEFEQSWQLLAEGWLPLPGDSQYWPEQVLVNDQPAVVIEQDGRPAIWLTKGLYQVRGQFVWPQLPERLTVPAEVAQIETRLDQKLLYPRRDANSLVLGEEQPQTTPEADRVQLKVFRLVRQAVPLQLETRLELDVSGREREFQLPQVLPKEFQALSLNSGLPGRLTAKGGLELLLRPGHWSIQIQALARELPQQLNKVEASGWPAEEYWSFAPDSRLGLWQWTGVASIDPRQTEIPQDWQALPAWLLTDQGLKLSQQAGSEQPDSAQLNLRRDLWLDFNSQQYLVRDQLQGSAGQLSRLSLQPPFQLLRVAQNNQDLLLTEHQQQTGVELRDSQLNLDATSLLPRQSSIPVNGWLDPLDSVAISLHLPPGWQLLAVSGAEDHSSWLLRWSLLDLFVALLIGIGVGKLFGWPYGAAALTLMLLSLQDFQAPVAVWLLLLVLTALARVLPAGRWSSVNQGLLGLSLLALLYQALPYAIAEVRQALYPQLSWSSDSYQPAQPLMATAPVMMSGAAAPETAMMMDMAEPAMRTKEYVKSRSMPVQQAPARPLKADPSLMTQTGPGLPDWTGDIYRFQLSGSVSLDQQIELWLMPPSLTRILRIIKVLLLGLLVWLLLPGNWQPWRGARAKSLLILPWLVMLGWATPDREALAQDWPTDTLLKQLAAKVNQPPACADQCSSLPLAELKVDGQSLQLTLHWLAQVDTLVQLPNIARQGQWLLDGQPARIRLIEQSAWLQLPAGIHQLSFTAKAPVTDLELEFGTPPLRIAAQLPEQWQLQGVDKGRLQAGSIRLIPATKASQQNSGERQWHSEIEPLVVIHRQLVLDQDWTLHTRVERLAPALGSIRTQLPLLAGESILSSNIRAENGQILLQLAPEQASLQWQSQLKPVGNLEWTASSRPEQLERWQLSYASYWQVEAAGLKPLQQSADGQFRQLEFLPWPGQTLQWQIQRPPAISGSQLAIDSVRLQLTPGELQEQGVLKFDYRSSKAGQHPLVLPTDLRVISLEVDGQKQDFHLEQQRLWLPLLPGSHSVQLSYQRPLAASSWYQSPLIDLGVAASNLRIELTPASKRWILFASGPQVGPAILFWGECLMLLVLALVFSRLNSPVKPYQWLLLALGLSLSSWPVLLLAAFWFWCLHRRQRQPVDSRFWFNTRQLGLVLLSLSLIGALFAAIVTSLLGAPDMHIVGNDSTAWQLNWFVDQTAGVLAQVKLLTLPTWLYQLVLLVWALWLAMQMLHWLVWAWQAYSRGGFWRSKPKLLAPTDESA